MFDIYWWVWSCYEHQGQKRWMGLKLQQRVSELRLSTWKKREHDDTTSHSWSPGAADLDMLCSSTDKCCLETGRIWSTTSDGGDIGALAAPLALSPCCLYHLGDTKLLNEWPFMNIKIDIPTDVVWLCLCTSHYKQNWRTRPLEPPPQTLMEDVSPPTSTTTLLEDVSPAPYTAYCSHDEGELCQKIAYNGTCQVLSTKYD